MVHFENILYLFLAILVGFAAKKLKLVGENARAVLSTYTLNVTFPFMVIDSMRFDFDERILSNSMAIFGIAFVIYVVSILLSEMSAKLWRLPDAQRASYHFGMVLSNNGFLGLPVLMVTYGQEAVFYGAIINLLFTVVNWTYGVFVFTRSTGTKIEWRKLINPSTIALVVGFSFFIFSVRLPHTLERVITGIGSTTTPNTMIIIGLMLAEIRLSELFTSFKPVVLAVYRNIAFPFVLYMVLKFFGLQGPLLYVPVVIFGMPVAANTAIFAQEYGKDFRTAAKLVIVSTMIALVTIPFLLEFVGQG